MKRLFILALLGLVAAQFAHAQLFTQVWRVDAVVGTRYSNTGDTYRGAAFNPVTNHYLVANRAFGNKIYVHDALNGNLLDSMNTGIVSGGTLTLVDVEVTSAGVIYATNLILSSGADTVFKIYRWENEAAAPTLAYSGRPGTARIGDAFDVAGTGTGTVIYASGNSATSVIQVFTTTDGINFTLGTPIPILGQEAGAGIAQVTPGGNAWVSRFASQNKIDLVNTTGAKIDSIETAIAGVSTGDLHYFTVAARKFLVIAPSSRAGGTFGNSEPARLLEVTAGGGAAVVIDTTTRLSANANANASGDADVKISGDTVTVFQLIGNNGIAAYRLVLPAPAVVISSITRSARVPNTSDSLVVTARIVDISGQGIVSDSLLYSRNGAAAVKVAMPRISGTNVDGTYRAVIPAGANSNGARIEYQLFARSASGTSTTTAVSPANSYFAGITPLTLTGARAMDANRALLYAGYYVRVTGTVNSPNFTVNSNRISYHFQDAVGGMNVNRASTLTPALNIGDSIIVIGVLGQFRGTTQLTPDDAAADIQIVATGRPLNPVTVTVAQFNANPEAYESRLIRMLSLQRLRATPAWGSNAAIPVYQYQQADSTLMFIDGDTPLPTAPEPTYPTTVTGVGGQFTTSTAVNNDGYEIIPRTVADFTTVHDIGATGINRTTSAFDRPERRRDGSVEPSIELVNVLPASYANNAPVVLQVIVRNYGDFAENSYQVGWQINGAAQSSVSNTRPLAIGGSDTLSLTWATPTLGSHTARAWTILATDSIRTNDTTGVYRFTVVPDDVIFQEGFNNTAFPPPGWLALNVDNDSLGNTWYLSASGPAPYEGPSYAAAFFGSSNSRRYIDDWLITPNTARTGSGVTDSLIFYAVSRFTSPGFPDSLDVRISTTGRDTANFTRIAYFRVPTTGWTRYAFALPQATTRYIAFRYLMYDGGPVGANSDKIGIDDVRIVRYLPPPPAGWTAQTSGTTANLRSVKALSATKGWIGANGGVVLKTTNGGANWQSVGAGAIGTGNVHCITALDENIAILGSTPSTTAYLFRTTNGGATWDTVYQQPDGFFDAVHMFDANNGVALGDPVGGKWTILRTTNGGTNWARIATEPVQIGGEAGWVNSFQAISTTHWWFGTDSSRVYKTTDGGVTWTWARTSFANSYAVWFNDLQYGVAGSSTGAVARSTDGGATWTDVTLAGSGGIYGIAGAGVDFWIPRGNIVYRSTNRGLTWNTEYTSTIGASLRPLNMVRIGNVTTGWVASNTGGIAQFYGALTSVKQDVGEVPTSFALQQNYPNPFNPTTTIRYALPGAARVSLSIYNLLGQRVAELASDVQDVGYYTVTWNGRNLSGVQVSSGVYFYRIEASPVEGGQPFVSLKKMMLLK